MSALKLSTLNEIHNYLKSEYTADSTFYDTSYDFKRATIAFAGVDTNSRFRPLLLGLDVLLYKYYEDEDYSHTDEDKRCVLLEITYDGFKKIYSDSSNYWDESKKRSVIPSLQEVEVSLVLGSSPFAK